MAVHRDRYNNIKYMKLGAGIPISKLMVLVIKKAKKQAEDNMDDPGVFDLYIKQKNLIITAYFGMNRLKDLSNGITFVLRNPESEDILYINDDKSIKIYDIDEEEMIRNLYDGALRLNIPKTVKEDYWDMKYALRKWNKHFQLVFGFQTKMNYNMLMKFRMISLIRDNNMPESAVQALFGYKTNVIRLPPMNIAQELIMSAKPGKKL